MDTDLRGFLHHCAINLIACMLEILKQIIQHAHEQFNPYANEHVDLKASVSQCQLLVACSCLVFGTIAVGTTSWCHGENLMRRLHWTVVRTELHCGISWPSSRIHHRVRPLDNSRIDWTDFLEISVEVSSCHMSAKFSYESCRLNVIVAGSEWNVTHRMCIGSLVKVSVNQGPCDLILGVVIGRRTDHRVADPISGWSMPLSSSLSIMLWHVCHIDLNVYLCVCGFIVFKE